MADEVRVTLGATLSNGELYSSIKTKKMTITQNYAEACSVHTRMSTTVNHPDFSAMQADDPSFLFLQNLSSKFTLYYGAMAQSTLIATFMLGPKETQFMRFNSGEPMYMTDIGFRSGASTDEPDLLIRCWAS